MAVKKEITLLINARDQASAIVGGIANKISGAFSAMFSLPGLAIGALGGAGLGAILADSLAAINEDEAATAKLGATLAATGHAAGFTVDQLTEYAASLQKVTTFGDETIVNAQAILATFKEIKGDVFQDAVKSMLDMSAVMGTDLQASAVQLGKALNDPMRGVSALRKVGVSFTQDQLALIRSLQETGDIAGAQKVILAELAGEFGGAATAMAQTAGGKLKQMQNALGDVKEGIGTVVNAAVAGFFPAITSAFGGAESWLKAHAEGIGFAFSNLGGNLMGVFGALWANVGPTLMSIGAAIYQGIQQALEFALPVAISFVETGVAVFEFFWNALTTGFGVIGGVLQSFMGWLGFSTDGLTGFRDAMIIGLTTIEFAFKHWQDLFVLGFLMVWGKALEFVNNYEWLFTSALPELLTWFATNWRTILADIANFGLTVWKNWAGNVVNVIKNLPGLISGAVSFADLWTPLTEGLQTALTPLPEITQRQLSPMEASIQDQIKRMTGDLGGGLDAMLQDRLARADKAGGAVRNFFADLAAGMRGPGGKTSGASGPAAFVPGEDLGGDDKSAGVAAEGPVRKAVASLQVSNVFRGIAAAFEAGNDPATRTARATEKNAEKLDDISTGIDELVAAVKGGGGYVLGGAVA